MSEKLVVMVALSVPLVMIFPSCLHVMSVRGRLNLVMFTDKVKSFPASSSGDPTRPAANSTLGVTV